MSLFSVKCEDNGEGILVDSGEHSIVKLANVDVLDFTQRNNWWEALPVSRALIIDVHHTQGSTLILRDNIGLVWSKIYMSDLNLK